MYINKNKNGYGYFSTVKSKDKKGEEIVGFLSVNFKQGTEPDGESYKGDLFLIDEDGLKRKAFFHAFKRADGTPSVGLMLMGTEADELKEQSKQKVIIEEIKADDLPFF
jgi:hypothetical protein